MTLHRNTRPLRTCLIAVALLVASSGCSETSEHRPAGFAGKPSEEILGAAIKAMGKVRSVRVRGTLTTDGERLRIDVRTDRRGRCAGTLVYAWGEARFISTTQHSFLKPDARYWRHSFGAGGAEETIRALGGRWSRSTPSKEYASFCSLPRTVIGTTAEKDDLRGGNVGAPRTFAGHRVVDVADDLGNEVTVDVAAPHYVRRLVGSDSDSDGTFTFSAFGKAAAVDVPGPGAYVDLPD